MDNKSPTQNHEVSGAIQRIASSIGVLTFVGHLPNETLAEIFLLVAASARERCSPFDSVRTQYSWLAITQVCRHWYSVAVLTPALWSKIIIQSSTDCAFVELALKRSKGALLDVEYDNGSSDRAEDILGYLPTLETVLSDALPRIRGLFLSITPWAYQRICGALSSQAAPSLRTWHLCTDVVDDDLPAAYLDHQNMPSLQVFCNRGSCKIPWNKLHSMATLTELDVGSSTFVFPSKVLDALSGMPLLKTLRLSLPNTESVDDSETLPIIAMENLEQCELASTPTFCIALSEHLRTPSNMSLLLIYSSMSNSERPLLLSPVLSKLSGATTLTSPPSIVSLRISISDYAVKLHGWGSFIEFGRDFPDMCIFRVGPMPYSPGQLAQFLDPLPLRTVQMLQVNSSGVSSADETSPFGIADFASLANRMPNLTTLVCSGWTSQAYRDILCKPFITITGGGFAWPSLTTLVLQDVGFNSTGKSLGDYDVRYMEILRAGLLDRKHRGCAVLDRLFIRGSIIDDSDLGILRDCAKEVIGEDNWLPGHLQAMMNDLHDITVMDINFDGFL